MKRMPGGIKMVTGEEIKNARRKIGKTQEQLAEEIDDGKRIVLIPDGKNNHKFTKSGRTKNTGLIRTLKKKHIGVPATFEMERYMDSEIWIGEIIKIKKNKK